MRIHLEPLRSDSPVSPGSPVTPFSLPPASTRLAHKCVEGQEAQPGARPVTARRAEAAANDVGPHRRGEARRGESKSKSKSTSFPSVGANLRPPARSQEAHEPRPLAFHVRPPSEERLRARRGSSDVTGDSRRPRSPTDKQQTRRRCARATFLRRRVTRSINSIEGQVRMVSAGGKDTVVSKILTKKIFGQAGSHEHGWVINGDGVGHGGW